MTDAKPDFLIAVEALVGAYGIENISLGRVKQAASACGQHVPSDRSIEELCHAIFRHRIAQMEPRRGAMLRMVEDAGMAQDAPTLLEIICLPQFDLVDESGRYPYPAFLVQYIHRFWRINAAVWMEADAIGPHLYRTMQGMFAALAPLSREIARMRVQHCHLMFLNALLNQGLSDSRTRDIILRDALDMAKAAISVGRSQAKDRPSLFKEMFPQLYR